MSRFLPLKAPMKQLLLAMALLGAGSSRAYDGLSSELSHAAGGALLAGAFTQLYKESLDRRLIGFGLSTAAVVLVEGVSISRGARASSQVLDIASHTLGAALGAWYADKYWLVPVIQPQKVGFVLHYRY